MSIREVVEGTQSQGEDEIISYTLDTANWGGTPSSPAVVVKDMSDGETDVTTTVMPTNSPSIATDIITLSPLKLLTADSLYKVEVAFITSGNTVEAFFYVRAET